MRNVLSSRASACDNCRWAAVAPENNPSGEWVMQARPRRILPPCRSSAYVQTDAERDPHPREHKQFLKRFPATVLAHCSQVVAVCDVSEGDELCFSYGERSNDDFFVHYGFVPLRNPRDEVRSCTHVA